MTLPRDSPSHRRRRPDSLADVRHR